MVDVRETVHAFGPSQALVGVLSQPDGGPSGDTRDVAVMIVNAGVIHRVGPNRLHVRLARTVAESGLSAFRFDLPGMGDSGTFRMAGSSTDEAMAGIRAALDELVRKRVATRFVVFGLCSGADLAFLAGCTDPRISGLILVDPNRVFDTPKSRLITLAHTALRPSVWFRALSGRYDLWGRVRGRLSRRRGEASGSASASEVSLSDQEARVRAEAALRMLMDRGIRILYILTGQYRSRYRYRRQLYDAFPGIRMDDQVVVEMLFTADHTFPSEVSRVRLQEMVADWLLMTFVSREAADLPQSADAR